MQIVINDNIEKKLRDKAFSAYGLKKGSISRAIEAAISDWIKK